MQPTSSSLVGGIADFADHHRWSEFHHTYRPMIRRILRNKGLRSDDLDDAVQDVYLSMLTTIERFKYDRSKGKFRSWLSKIVERTAFAQHRKRASMPTGLTAEVAADPELLDVKDERMELCLQLARSQIDERTWLPFYLRVIEELPTHEVERLTKLSRNAVYKAVYRVKHCLRGMIEDLEHDGCRHPES